jgi:hypothetical protein
MAASLSNAVCTLHTTQKYLNTKMPSIKTKKIEATSKARQDSATSNTSTFQHKPLDYRRGAIRLLKILPSLSSTGLIQCEIWHDSVNATYDCLSYVWGPDKIQQHILLNGRPCRVRQNLWDFMRVARSKYASPPRTFWIDALCIDQDSVWEKNHQVAQMGSIYSNAVEVISWLGFSDSIVRAFTFGIKAGPSPSFSHKHDRIDHWAEWLTINTQTHGQLRKDWLAVVHNTYWTRAWITQEIFLARRIKLLVNDLEVEPVQVSRVSLDYAFDYKEGPSRDGKERDVKEMDTPTSVFLTYMNSMCGDRWRGDRQLINLFDRLPGRQSYLIHDQVYSLLSIATDAASIPVDYRCSKDDLLRQLLKIYGKSLCICSWFYMLDMLDCSLIPGFKTAVLMIPMKLVQTEFVMGEKQRDWYDTCSSCHVRMSSFDERETRSFCIKSLCEGVRGGHLYLKQARNGKYSLKRNDGTPAVDVLRVELAKSGYEDDIDLGSGGTYATVNVYLAVDVVMRFFEYPTKTHGVREVPLRICPRASKGHRRMEFGEEFS